MKRRGFLAVLAALPLMPFATQRATATGGYYPGGMYADGSEGPELVTLPAMQGGSAEIQVTCTGEALVHGELPEGATPSELINPHELIFRVHDGPVASIKAYDGHVALTLDRDYATAEELLAATGKLGRYATCRAEGLWKKFGSFRGHPAFVWGAETT